MWHSVLVAKLRESARHSRRYSERHFKAFGYIALLLVPATAFVEQLVADPHFRTIYVRLIAALAGAILLFRKSLPKFLRTEFELVWVGITTLVLPVCFGLILTINAALTEPGASLPPIWIYQYLVAIFIFVQLIHNALLSAVLWLLALVPTLGAVLWISEPNVPALLEAWMFPLPVYMTALIIGSFANRNIEVIESEKIRAASAIGSNTAHELRTPLASIGLLSRAVQRYLPILVDGYERHIQETGRISQVSKYQLYELRRALLTIQGEVDYSNTVINILLANTSDTPIESRVQDRFFASQAIAEAVNRYPFNNSDEQSILQSSTQNDFRICAPYVLVVHVLFNLIKNAVFYAQSRPQGSVKVFSGMYQGRPSIIVTDTGCGISESVRSKIFDRFFTTTEAGQGAGIGLSFCKMVMEGIGGEIICDSKEGEYTTFRLLFPEVS